MKLNNKIAIVTGGAKGIGFEMCRLFSAEGARVVSADIAEAISKPLDGVEYYRLNVADTAECSAFFEYMKEKYDRMDILVNNAGITRDAMTRKMTDEQWDLVLDVDLKAAFNLVRLIGPQMEENGYGAILNISSVVGEYGNIGQANYAAAKAGLMGLTKTWAKEFARKGAAVRVNCITPGYTMTDILKTVPEELLKDFASRTMLGRLGEPEEIAKAALFLVSDDASYITGQTLAVNGGMRL